MFDTGAIMPIVLFSIPIIAIVGGITASIFGREVAMNLIRARRRVVKALVALTCAFVFTGLGLLLAAGAGAAEAEQGKLVKTAVHGESLKDNQLGFSPERDCFIYLPPSYDIEQDRKYPVLYLLHGIGDSPVVWNQAWESSEPGYATIQQLMDRGIHDGLLEEMIVVMPDAGTPFFGCFYTNSPIKGRWDDFITEDLVAWIDERYRTSDAREARGIAGHSMGGYGALKLAMLHPEVFSVAYGMNPAIMDWGGDITAENPHLQALYAVKSPPELQSQSFYVTAVIGISQAFSPNPNNSPFFADYPFKMEGGKLVSDGPGYSGWQANMPVHMVPRYTNNLMALRGLRFDTAFIDKYPHIPETTKRFSDVLTEHGVPHIFEMYNGDHNNRLWGSQGRLYTEVLPYFSDLLVREGGASVAGR